MNNRRVHARGQARGVERRAVQGRREARRAREVLVQQRRQGRARPDGARDTPPALFTSADCVQVRQHDRQGHRARARAHVGERGTATGVDVGAQVLLRLFELAVQPARFVDVRRVPVLQRPRLVAAVALVADLEHRVLRDRPLEAHVPRVGPRHLDVRVEVNEPRAGRATAVDRARDRVRGQRELRRRVERAAGRGGPSGCRESASVLARAARSGTRSSTCCASPEWSAPGCRCRRSGTDPDGCARSCA